MPENKMPTLADLPSAELPPLPAPAAVATLDAPPDPAQPAGYWIRIPGWPKPPAARRTATGPHTVIRYGVVFENREASILADEFVEFEGGINGTRPRRLLKDEFVGLGYQVVPQPPGVPVGMSSTKYAEYQRQGLLR